MNLTGLLSALLIGMIINSGSAAAQRTGKTTTARSSKSQSSSKSARVPQPSSPKNSSKTARDSKTPASSARASVPPVDYDSKAAFEAMEVERITGLEKESIQADLKKDKAWFDNYLADDLTSANPEGLIEDKTRLMARRLDPGNVLTSKAYDELTVRPYGEDVIIATGKLSQKGRNNDAEYNVQRTFFHVWVNRLGRWEQVAVQESPVLSASAPSQPAATPPPGQAQKTELPAPSPSPIGAQPIVSNPTSPEQLH